ncbi:MAG: hypothetical protein Q4P20_03430 [Eubacteriales bacterium]|nr:hypothetical protein [Eubacteriales bacterium]
MKRAWRSLMLCAVMVCAGLLLAACGPSFDASGYVKAALDSTVHGESAEYVKIVDITAEEAQQEYDDVLDSMVEEISSLGLSDELNSKYRTLFADLLKQTDYTVLEATKTEDSYEVPVEIKPITNVFNGLMDDVETKMTEYSSEILNGNMDVPSEEEITEYAGQMVYDLLAERVANIEYGDAQTVTVTVEPDDDGVYSVPEDDIEDLVTTMIDMGDLLG